MSIERTNPITGTEAQRRWLQANAATIEATEEGASIGAQELHTSVDGAGLKRVFRCHENIGRTYHLGTVANEAAMLALDSPLTSHACLPGDTCFRTDTQQIMRCISNYGASLTDWEVVPYSGDPSGIAASAVSTHNTAPDSHADLRTLVAGKQDSLTISDVGTALLNLSTPTAEKIPRVNADASVTLIDLPGSGNVEEVDADFVSISYNPSGAGTSFEPSDILDLRAHYDPSVAGSCLDSTLAPLSSEGACRRWLDLTGNERHLEETDAAYQATFKPAFVNGVAALDLGSSGRFSRVLNLGTEGYPEITIYMLRARKTSGATWGNWFTNTAAYEGPNKLNAHAPYDTGASYFDFGNDTSYRLNPGYQTLSYDHTAWHSLAFVRSRQRMMLFVNGSLESASSIQAPLTAFTDSNETIYFGNHTTSHPANAYFGPLLMFGRALTPYELGQLDAYYSAIGYR